MKQRIYVPGKGWRVFWKTSSGKLITWYEHLRRKKASKIANIAKLKKRGLWKTRSGKLIPWEQHIRYSQRTKKSWEKRRGKESVDVDIIEKLFEKRRKQRLPWDKFLEQILKLNSKLKLEYMLDKVKKIIYFRAKTTSLFEPEELLDILSYFSGPIDSVGRLLIGVSYFDENNRINYRMVSYGTYGDVARSQAENKIEEWQIQYRREQYLGIFFSHMGILPQHEIEG